jgi:hypothetical protein
MWSPWKNSPAVALLFLFAACSDSPVPVVHPSEATLDARLFGTWVAQDRDSSDTGRIRVVPFDKHQAVAELLFLETVEGVYELEAGLFREISDSVDLGDIETVEELRAILRERCDDPDFLDDDGVRFIRYDADHDLTQYPAREIRF